MSDSGAGATQTTTPSSSVANPSLLSSSSEPTTSTTSPDQASLNKNNNNTMSSSSTKENSSFNNTSSTNFKFLLLVLMVLQNSSTVLVGRHTRSSVKEEDLYVVNHLILVSECSKFFLACLLEYSATNGHLMNSIQQNILNRPLDTLKSLVPALLYLVQNSLLYTALSNLSAPLFQVTYQGKLVTTALVSVVMLQRKYSCKQWICLVVLSLGVAVVVLGESKDDEQQEDSDRPPQSLAKGLTAVTIACMSSALAGVYFEKVLKKKDGSNTGGAPVSLWMRNMQLAFFSVVIAHVQGLSSSKPPSESNNKPYLHGFTMWVWILVALQAGGGMLVAAVIKYADNVLKGLATGVSVVVATACSMGLFGTPLTGQFSVGACMILVSVYLFSNNVPAWCSGRSKVFGGGDGGELKLYKKDVEEGGGGGGEATKPLILPK